MIFNKSDYNPFPAIKEAAAAETKISMAGTSVYRQAFFDYVRKQLFMGGVVAESDEEVSEILKVLTEMEII